MPPLPLDQDEVMPDPPSDAPEMEESSSSVDALTVDSLLSGRFTWTIKNFSRLDKKVYSEIFNVGGHRWKILLFPKGNSVDHLSLYLDVADSMMLATGWSRFAQFCLTVVNQFNTQYSFRKESQHLFNARESDWGFTNFMPLAELYDPSRGYCVNDTCIVEADVAIRKVLDYWSHDSKKETGYVGLKNQGATCYMNSLLQTLFHIPYFRKALYHMPTTENDIPSRSIPLALQSLFYKLQHNDTSVATKELTKSFGWDTHDSFLQHDVQELNRVLCEKLESKMKGTVVEGTIQQLFEGHHMNYIDCINVDYKSMREESFYDLQLDVKGCQNVYDSFDKYIEVEQLEGDNKYHAEWHGLQEARKGVLFVDLPPVLQLQLKRFEYDFMRDTMVKINDYYEFPLQLDLDRDNGKYLSPKANRNIRNLYTLHSVLVHSGGVHGGHYYAYIRPTLSNQWFKFDDERVTREDSKRAIEEQYGGEEELPHTNPGFNNSPFKFTKYSNAYMLVYIRDSDKDKIICNVDEKDIAQHLRVAREEDMRKQIGNDIFFDLVDHDKVWSFRIKKQMPFMLVKEEVAREFNIPVPCQRFWLWAKRQNHTFRLNRPMTSNDETQLVGELREIFMKGNNAELNLYLEFEAKAGFGFCPPTVKTNEDLLLFFKVYDPSQEKLWYVGSLYVKGYGKPLDILSRLNQMAGFAIDEEIELFEEIKFEPRVMCEYVDKNIAFIDHQLEDGDIICYQKFPKDGSGEQLRCPTVYSFLEYVHNRQVVRFRFLEKPKEDEFSLELSKLHTYDDVVIKVAQHLGLSDSSKIRLTSHNCYSQQPKSLPIKYQGVENLSDMLIHLNQISDILYYEILDIPLPELQSLKTLKIAFHLATKDEVVISTVRLPKQSTVEDVLNDIKSKVNLIIKVDTLSLYKILGKKVDTLGNKLTFGTKNRKWDGLVITRKGVGSNVLNLEVKVDLSHPDAQLRLLEVFYHKIYKIFLPSETIENINDEYWKLRAEEIPEEDRNLGPLDRLIHVYHFFEDTAHKYLQIHNFGDPFLFVIHGGETLADVKLRLRKKLQVPDAEFSNWKFAFVLHGRPEYLQDSDIICACFQRRDVFGSWEQYLGLEHTDSAPKRSYAVNQVPAVYNDHFSILQNRHTIEKPVKIYN
ncbi:hypothetical protein ACSQ67_014562 [Phaseolus vulgaris]